MSSVDIDITEIKQSINDIYGYVDSHDIFAIECNPLNHIFNWPTYGVMAQQTYPITPQHRPLWDGVYKVDGEIPMTYPISDYANYRMEVYAILENDQFDKFDAYIGNPICFEAGAGHTVDVLHFSGYFQFNPLYPYFHKFLIILTTLNGTYAGRLTPNMTAGANFRMEWDGKEISYFSEDISRDEIEKSMKENVSTSEEFDVI